MGANKLARTFDLVETTPLNEALERLRVASSALDGFTNLLAGFTNVTNLKAQELSNLIEPIRSEVAAALDELEHV